jgi:chromosome segregation ATPase
LDDFVELKCKFNKLLEENNKQKKHIEKLEKQIFQKNLELMDCERENLELEQKVEELENELNLYKKLIKDLYTELKSFEKLNIKKFDIKV